MEPLTKREADCLAFIRANAGRERRLTLKEIAHGIGLKSKGSISYFMQRLAAKGWINKNRTQWTLADGVDRKITLDDETWKALEERFPRTDPSLIVNEAVRQFLEPLSDCCPHPTE